jgi:hypothetical protein
MELMPDVDRFMCSLMYEAFNRDGTVAAALDARTRAHDQRAGRS